MKFVVCKLYNLTYQEVEIIDPNFRDIISKTDLINSSYNKKLKSKSRFYGVKIVDPRFWMSEEEYNNFKFSETTN
ncbi:MAG: hypothetical protein WAR79_00540 [Melioribacteraceae bacterium]